MKLLSTSPLLLVSTGAFADTTQQNDVITKLSASLQQLHKYNLQNSHSPDGPNKNRQLEDWGICGQECGDYNLCECFNGDLTRCSLSSIQDRCQAGSISNCVPSWLQASCSTMCITSGDGSIMSSLEMYCAACDLLDCCDGVNSFESCAENLPDLESLLANALGAGDVILEEEGGGLEKGDTDDGGENDDGFFGELGDWITNSTGLFENDDNLFEGVDDWNFTWPESQDDWTPDFTETWNSTGLFDDDDNLFQGVDDWNFTSPEWHDDDFSWNYGDDFISGILSGGLQDTIMSLLPGVAELIANPDSILPQFCPDGSCPVSGFCECLSGGIGQCSTDLVHDVCSAGAFFSCGPEGFEDMCTTACSGDDDGDVLNMAFCALCDIATCCNDGISTIEDCAMAALPFDDDLEVGGMTSLIDDDFVSGLLSGDGLENITNLFPFISDIVGNPDSILPEFCPGGTCPVNGFCECLSGDLSLCTVDLVHDVCTTGALFSCGPEGFENMCKAECIGNDDGDVLNMAFCALCDIATCCNDGISTIEDCAIAAVAFDDDDFGFKNISAWIDDDFVAGLFSGDGTDIVSSVLPLISDLVGNPDYILPEFCPDGTCPVDGFCECISGDLSLCSTDLVHDVCSSGAFFSCGPEGFEDMCATECSGDGDGDVLNMAFCALCDIATCCSNGASSIEECAMDLVPFDGNFGLNNITSLLDDDYVLSIISVGALDNITNLFPLVSDLVGNPDSILSEFCPDGACPVDGFCECLSGDLTECSVDLVHDVCSEGALFSCGPDGFEDMCKTECSGNDDGDVLNMAFCALCDIATCCNDGTSTIEDCALESLPSTEGLLPIAEIIESLSDGDAEETSSTLSGFDLGSIGSFAGVFSSLLPEFCPDGTCPVDGFCECYGGDFTRCTEKVLIDSCEANALYECGTKEFEDNCITKCTGEEAAESLDAILCMVCDVANCCRDGGLGEECTAQITSLIGGFASDAGYAADGDAAAGESNNSTVDVTEIEDTSSSTDNSTEALPPSNVVTPEDSGSTAVAFSLLSLALSVTLALAILV